MLGRVRYLVRSSAWLFRTAPSMTHKLKFNAKGRSVFADQIWLDAVSMPLLLIRRWNLSDRTQIHRLATQEGSEKSLPNYSRHTGRTFTTGARSGTITFKAPGTTSRHTGVVEIISASP